MRLLIWFVVVLAAATAGCSSGLARNPDDGACRDATAILAHAALEATAAQVAGAAVTVGQNPGCFDTPTRRAARRWLSCYRSGAATEVTQPSAKPVRRVGTLCTGFPD